MVDLARLIGAVILAVGGGYGALFFWMVVQTSGGVKAGSLLVLCLAIAALGLWWTWRVLSGWF